jgi:hypothetical protein
VVHQEDDPGPGPDGSPVPFEGRTRASIPYRRPAAAPSDTEAWSGSDRRAAGPVPRPPFAPGPDGPGPDGPGERRRWRRLLILAVSVLLIVAAAVALRWGRPRSGETIPAVPTRPAIPLPVPGSPAISGTPGPAASRRGAPASSGRSSRRSVPPAARPVSTLHVTADASSVTIRTTDLGSFLMRVLRVDGGTARAGASDHGRDISVTVVPDGARAAAVEIAVDRSVRWNVETDGGTDRTVLDLAAGPVGRVELRGSPDATLRLPAPDGVTDVRISGATARCTVRTPRTVPARVTLSGAGRLTVDGRTRTAGRGETVLVGEGGARNRIDFEASDVGALRWERS